MVVDKVETIISHIKNYLLLMEFHIFEKILYNGIFQLFPCHLIINENITLDDNAGTEILDTVGCYLLNQLVRALARRKPMLD